MINNAPKGSSRVCGRVFVFLFPVLCVLFHALLPLEVVIYIIYIYIYIQLVQCENHSSKYTCCADCYLYPTPSVCLVPFFEYYGTLVRFSFCLEGTLSFRMVFF